MAAGRLSAPGTTYGPCPEICEHLDCRSTKRLAAEPCAICKDAIGFERPFYQFEPRPPDVTKPTNLHAHQSCFLKEIET